MNLKKKLLCGTLASIFILNGIAGNLSASAMMENNTGSPATAIDPSVNLVDEEGYTPLMRAVDELDVEKVKKLLSKGADLNIPPAYAAKYWETHDLSSSISRVEEGDLHSSNVLERLFNRSLGKYRDSQTGKIIDYIAEDIKRSQEITIAILEHCVKNDKQLKVKPWLFTWATTPPADGNYSLGTTYNVWGCFGKILFKNYRDERKDLFTIGSESPFGLDGAIKLL